MLVVDGRERAVQNTSLAARVDRFARSYSGYLEDAGFGVDNSALEAFGVIERAGGRPLLLGLLRHECPAVRAFAAHAIVTHRPADLDALHPLLEDPTPLTATVGCELRITTVRALVVDFVCERVGPGAGGGPRFDAFVDRTIADARLPLDVRLMDGPSPARHPGLLRLAREVLDAPPGGSSSDDTTRAIAVLGRGCARADMPRLLRLRDDPSPSIRRTASDAIDGCDPRPRPSHPH